MQPIFHVWCEHRDMLLPCYDGAFLQKNEATKICRLLLQKNSIANHWPGSRYVSKK